MFANQTETDALLRSTRTLIDEEGMDITLQRAEWETTPAGGVVKVGDSVPQATVRRFFGATTSNPIRYVRDEGEQRIFTHVLIGLPGDDIQGKDTFAVGTRTFIVLDVMLDVSYMTKGWCSEVG